MHLIHLLPSGTAATAATISTAMSALTAVLLRLNQSCLQACRLALLCIWAADACFAALFCPAQIKYVPKHYQCYNKYNNNIFHNHFANAYSVFKALFVFDIRNMITPSIAKTAASPAIAAPRLSVAGAVISVPMV